MALSRVKEYFSNPYEHPGERKLVQKLGQSMTSNRNSILMTYRLLHPDVLLFIILHELSRSI
jgi:hypothetical protein